MIDAPELVAIYATYEDQLEALRILFRARDRVLTDPRSRFAGISHEEFELRLEEDRNELDRWVVMMLVASFEATIRTDADRRIKARSRDKIRRSLHELFKRQDERVRLVNILELWEAHVGMTAAKKNAVRHLLRHRHWLAHGRHWTNKHGAFPEPQGAILSLNEYVDEIRVNTADFPRR